MEEKGITQELINKMLLPEGCYLVERAQRPESIILEVNAPPLQYGKIVLAAEDLEEYIGDTVYFRESHVEEIEINKKKYVYLTNLKHSIYYVITE